ncbi:MAG: hypothetical protein KJ706_00315 [Candidatus Omnitrophica bacterium]|nr:hypothetical protein [Candidatus Omnitrophota bacterium]
MRIKLDNMCISLNTGDPKIRKVWDKAFGGCISTDRPLLHINAEFRDFAEPSHKNVIVRTRGHELGLENGRKYILYKNNSAIAWFDAEFKNVDVYIRDSKGTAFIGHIVLYMILLGLLNQRKIACLHSSGVRIRKRGFLFVGPSGSGKTTIARLAAKYADAKVIHDDHIKIQKNGRGIEMHHNRIIQQRRRRPEFRQDELGGKSKVDAVFFLDRGERNLAVPLKSIPAIFKLIRFSTLTLITNREVGNLFDLYKDVVREIPCYNLKFVPDRSVWDYIQKEVRLR